MSLGIDKLANACAKSIYQTSTHSPFSYASIQSFKHSNSWLPVECCFKNHVVVSITNFSTLNVLAKHLY